MALVGGHRSAVCVASSVDGASSESAEVHSIIKMHKKKEQVQVLYFTQKCTKCFKNQNKRLDTRLGDIARDSKVKQYITMPMECRKFTKMHTKKVNCAAFKCTNIL